MKILKTEEEKEEGVKDMFQIESTRKPQ